jgi:hypothetical protein
MRLPALLIAAALSVAPLVASAAEAVEATQQQLFDQLEAMDTKLFTAAFETCDLKALRGMVTDDLEFYHDRDGLSATSGDQFIEQVRQYCDARKTPTGDKVRRELVAGSLTVHPLKGYGAVQMGVHRFWVTGPGQAERLGDSANFIHVWKQDGVRWRLARVISYDHGPSH